MAKRARYGHLRATHHASTSKHGIVNGVGGNISIWSAEGDLDHNKIVNVLKVIPNEFLSMFRCAILDNQVSGSANSYLICYVAGQDELTIVPTNIDLLEISN
jgi:hypothetical protein